MEMIAPLAGATAEPRQAGSTYRPVARPATAARASSYALFVTMKDLPEDVVCAGDDLQWLTQVVTGHRQQTSLKRRYPACAKPFPPLTSIPVSAWSPNVTLVAN